MATYRRRGDEGEFDDFRVLDCNGTEIYFNLGMSFLELMEALIHEPAPRGDEWCQGAEVRLDVETATITLDRPQVVRDSPGMRLMAS